MTRILVVEDDSNLNGVVCEYLKYLGYIVDGCQDGREALEYLSDNKYSLVITDIMMPKMDGYELAKAIRSTDDKLPIMFMTAREDIQSKQRGYDLGIDEYIVKPFSLEELAMRVKALLRRADIQETKSLVIGNLKMDREEHVAYIDGKPIDLTVREFDILMKLLSYPRKAFTRAQLMDDFYGYDTSNSSRTVDVYMTKIREKTAKCDGFDIVTVHGLGYKAVPRV
ncbi:MAG TPA: DNA-binding response regulator [Firmicutes bacterium]|nr:DNA-binding response regulator [Bacillota bacterium]